MIRLVKLKEETEKENHSSNVNKAEKPTNKNKEMSRTQNDGDKWLPKLDRENQSNSGLKPEKILEAVQEVKAHGVAGDEIAGFLKK